MSRVFAPANADGLKPWYVDRYQCGRFTSSVVYAKSARDAEYRVKGRQLHVFAHARRATVEDLAARVPEEET